MFCNKCGVELPDNSVFCLSCGNKLKADTDEKKELKAEQDNESLKTFKDKEIREELAKYNKHINIKCFECGYEGLMGVTNEKVMELWKRILIFILVIIGLVIVAIFWSGLTLSVYSFILMGIIFSINNRRYVICPNCKKKLKPTN